MWYCYPDLVKMERAQDNPHQHDPIYHVDPRYAGDTLCYVPSSPAEMEKMAKKSGGTSGASTKASQKLGEQYHTHLVNRMLEAIAFLQKSS